MGSKNSDTEKVRCKGNRRSSRATISILKKIFRKVEPFFVDEASRFANFCITIGAIFLTQVFFWLLLNLFSYLFGEVPLVMTIILYISDISSTYHFIKAIR